MNDALDPALTPEQAFERLRRPGAPSLLLDGRGRHDDAWRTTLAIEPRPLSETSLASIDALIRERRRHGGPGGTGVAVLAPYDRLAPPGPIALEIDASIRFEPGHPPNMSGPRAGCERATRALEARPPSPSEPAPAFDGRPVTSLNKAAYLEAVARVRQHITLGDIYQANLTQRLDRRFQGDPWSLYRRLIASTPAPRSAFVEGPGWALASASPETFVDIDAGGCATTRPIKGTRPRGTDDESDRAAATALLASEKDRAELTMIVDLERNDLGRIAKPGTVSVLELAALRSYPAVHHLVATVTAMLRDGVGFSELMRAVFPGGSITGAPKIRAMEILATLERRPRDLYTGSLFWLDDDGSMLSSILIRSIEFRDGVARVGAGGGIVADSDPEAEWMESNAKARALTRILGFEPEEAE